MTAATATSKTKKSPIKKTKTVEKKMVDKKKDDTNMSQKKRESIALDATLVQKASEALLKHHQSTQKDAKDLLAPESVPVFCQFGLQVAPGRPQIKPIRIILPHALRKTSDNDDEEHLEEPEVCLIVKNDSCKEWVEELMQKFPKHMHLKKVITLESLRKNHATFSQKRTLLHSYDVFLADDRILPMLTSALGRDFLRAKKQPLPISVTRREALPFAIQKALQATYLTWNTGTCLSVQAGTTGMTATQLAENVTAVAQAVPSHLPRRKANLHCVSIKTPKSVALPIFTQTPAELAALCEQAGIRPVFQEQKEKVKVAKKEEEEKDIQKEKKRQLKSPLLQALKKQKKDAAVVSEKEANKAEKGTKKSDKSPKKVEEKTEKKVEKKEVVSKKVEQKTTKNEEASKKVEKKDSDEALSATKKKGSKKDKTPEAKKATPASASASKVSSSPKENPSFVPSKKFTGSKPGYAFRTGKEGLGYYVDVKPVVDKMAIAALAKLSSQKRGGGSSRRSKSPGGRRRR